MTKVPVGKNQFALIDDQDWLEVANLLATWYLETNGYARTKVKGKLVYLHTFIYSLVDESYKGDVDHANRDRLDCRRNNLRAATKQQTSQNRSVQSNNSTGFPGVFEYKRYGNYQAQIGSGRKKKHLGYFNTLIEAVEAREKAQRELFGNFDPNQEL